MLSAQIVDAVPWLMLAKVTGLLVLLFLFTQLLRGRSERLRYLIWLVGFAGLVLLPVASASMPWKLELLPAVTERAETPSTQTIPEGDRTSSRMQNADAEQALAPPGPRPLAQTDGDSGSGRFASPGVSAASLLAAVWMLGAFIVLARIAHGSTIMARLVRTSEPLPELAELARALAMELGVTRPVRLGSSAAVSMPVTWGVLKPVVMLPLRAEAWPLERQRAVLLHELAHVRRFDALGLVLAQLACAVYWFHPLVWLALRQMNLARECACDEMAIGNGVPRIRYASLLVQIARGLRQRAPAPGLLPMAHRSQLRRRLKIILDGGAGATVGRGLASLVIALTAIATSAVAALTPLVPAETVAETTRPMGSELRPATPEKFGTQEPARRRTRPEREQERSRIVFRAWEDRIWGEGRSRSVRGDRFFEDEQQSYVSRNNDYTIGKWRIAPSLLGLELEGTVHVTSDDRRLHTLSSGGYFIIEERRESGRRRYEARTGPDGLLAQTVYENERAGRLGEIDAWLARMILAAVRRTGIDATERTARILRDSGLDGVLGEIDQLASNHVRVRYFHELIGQGDLDAAELRRAVRAIATAITSNGDKSRVLISVAEKYTGDLELTREFLTASETISSDGDRARLLHAVLERPGLDDSVAALTLRSIDGISSSGDKSRLLIDAASRFAIRDATGAAYFEAADGIESSGDLSRVLIAVVQASPEPDTVHRASVSARAISSEGDKSRVLIHIIDRARLSDEISEAFFDAANTIGSAGDRARVLIRAIGQSGLSTRVQRKILQSARDVQASGDLSRVLISFSGSYDITEAISDDYFDAFRSINSSGPSARTLISLARENLPRSVVMKVLDAVSGIGSNGDRSRVLVEFSERCRDDVDLRAAYTRAAESISSRGDRERAMRAIGR